MIPTAPPPYSTAVFSQSDAAQAVPPALSLSFASDPSNKEVLVSLVPPRAPVNRSGEVLSTRAPVDVCCVIDVSGSMQSELKAILEEGSSTEFTGLSTLDVVKHAVKTIMATMTDDDRIAIVTFSDAAEIITGLTHMTTGSKGHVLQLVEKLYTQNCTNLWEGLKVGMNILNGIGQPPTPASSARVSSLFLLTDGMPNSNPPRGIVPMLETYLKNNPPRFSINTFGFGYSLDSHLLLEIARLGQGIFGFIPEASSLGATFIHAVANLYSTCADQVQLFVKCLPGSYLKIDSEHLTIVGKDEKSGKDDYGTSITVGPVQYGQNRDLIIKLNNKVMLESSTEPLISVTARYRPWTQDHRFDPRDVTISLSERDLTSAATGEDYKNVRYHSHRGRFIRILKEISDPVQFIFHLTSVVPILKSLSASLRTSPLSDHKWSMALDQDIVGEVLLALDKQPIFDRWGKHYLLSLGRMHQFQQCGSYRDPGLQIYGEDSPLFIHFRDAMDQAFDNLPPPKPTLSRTSSTTHRAPQITSMSAAFAQRSGPCFEGNCLIVLDNGEKVPVKNLMRGVRVKTPKGSREVVAVLRTIMSDNKAHLCVLPNQLKITPWHPIAIDSDNGLRWVFPNNCVEPEIQDCRAVYSLLLEPDSNVDAHGVYVQDILCVTLGHGLTVESPEITDIRAHEFLGSYECIMRSLASFTVSETGVFDIKHVLKDQTSGKICGFVPYESAHEVTQHASCGLLGRTCGKSATVAA
ncbi:hint-domain-containing protein [Hysterangium stoloniferum]|nr:hint-domain-containing protein [Hysterangium stoloniferum]